MKRLSTQLRARLQIIVSQFAALTYSDPLLLLCPGCDVRSDRCQCDEHMKAVKRIRAARA